MAIASIFRVLADCLLGGSLSMAATTSNHDVVWVLVAAFAWAVGRVASIRETERIYYE